MFDHHTYPGGAWRIHMLRKRMGDEAFWSGVQTYVERFAKKTVQTSDFQNCLEEASGLNLTRFFDEWIYSKGYPKLKGQYNYEANRVKITLTQTQIDEAAQVPLFGFDLDVEVVTKAGKKVKTVVNFDQRDTVTAVVDLPEGDKPSQVCVDPEGKVLFTLEMPSVDRDILIETAKESESLVNRIWAYGELIADGSRPALKAVNELLEQEPYHGVRIEGICTCDIIMYFL
jgi:aminopeptidase N